MDQTIDNTGVHFFQVLDGILNEKKISFSSTLLPSQSPKLQVRAIWGYERLADFSDIEAFLNYKSIFTQAGLLATIVSFGHVMHISEVAL